MRADSKIPLEGLSAWPRYTERPFPSYRFVPGSAPHPRRHPEGHSYGQVEPEAECLHQDTWPESHAYRYGIDLFNFAYWWESHEVFEEFWHAAGQETEQGQFFQGLIQLAAGHLKRVMGNEAAAANLFRSSLRRFSGLPDQYLGITIADLRIKLQPGHTGNILLELKLPELAHCSPRPKTSYIETPPTKQSADRIGSLSAGSLNNPQTPVIVPGFDPRL